MPDFVFSNARVKAKEKNLLSSAQINRLLDAKSLDEAFKLLLDSGYGGGVSVDGADFDKLFSAEEDAATKLLRELDVENSGLKVFLSKNDYHNVKALYKARVENLLNEGLTGLGSMLAPDGNTTLEKLAEAVVSRDYADLPEHMRDALKSLDKLADLEKLTPRAIDVAVDKAMYADIFDELKRVKNKQITDYFVKSADAANISSFVRAKKLGLSFMFFESGFIGGGELDLNFYEPLFEQSAEAFKEKMKYTHYAKIASAIEKNGLMKFETECDNMLLDIFKQNKSDMFSVSPVAGLYLGKLTELKTVKLIVAALKNGVESKDLKQRMRELYA